MPFRSLFVFLLFLSASTWEPAVAQKAKSKVAPDSVLIFFESFQQPLDTTRWKIEMEPSPGSIVAVQNAVLELKTGKGVTVWLNQLLKGNIAITYERQVLVQDGPFDRLSDFNQFWMARDPRSKNLFTRSGKLEDYDSLQLYYVGMGGNTNKTTRFRRYDGKGERQLIGEFTDTAHLLKPNQWYQILIRVQNGQVSYWVNGERYFLYNDPIPLTQGYFGFRSTKSHQQIRNLTIYQLQ